MRLRAAHGALGRGAVLSTWAIHREENDHQSAHAAEQHEKTDTFYACERSYGSFARAFTLPDGADTEHMRAELKNGVLTVVVPKVEEKKPRRIAVGTGEVKKS